MKKGLSVEENNETSDTYIPVKVSNGRKETVTNEDYGRIELSFLRGAN
jgi:hypothetical protein